MSSKTFSIYQVPIMIAFIGSFPNALFEISWDWDVLISCSIWIQGSKITIKDLIKAARKEKLELDVGDCQVHGKQFLIVYSAAVQCGTYDLKNLELLTKVTSRNSSSSLISEKAEVMLEWKSFQRRQNCSVAILLDMPGLFWEASKQTSSSSSSSSSLS